MSTAPDTTPANPQLAGSLALPPGSASEAPAIAVARELAESAKRAGAIICFQHMQAVFLLRHIKGAIIALEHDQSPVSVQRVLETLRTVHASGCYEMDHLAMPSPNHTIGHTEK